MSFQPLQVEPTYECHKEAEAKIPTRSEGPPNYIFEKKGSQTKIRTRINKQNNSTSIHTPT